MELSRTLGLVHRENIRTKPSQTNSQSKDVRGFWLDLSPLRREREQMQKQCYCNAELVSLDIWKKFIAEG